VSLDRLPNDATPEQVTAKVAERLSARLAVAVATVVARRGSAPATPGQKLALWRDAGTTEVLGTVGGGAVEFAVIQQLKRQLDERNPEVRVHTFQLGPSLGMCCGGSADVLIEPFNLKQQVLLIGAGHVGLRTATLLAELDFEVVLSDERECAHEGDRLAKAAAAGVAIASYAHDDPELLALLGPPRGAALLVATHDHQLDQRAIEWALGHGFAYVGGVGSKRKAIRTSERLSAKGVSSKDIDRVRMPVGLPVGARSPMEIAVAIAAELVAWRAERAKQRTRSSAEPKPSIRTEAPSESLVHE
jgi:xanthine dehydrogenase accessory factor